MRVSTKPPGRLSRLVLLTATIFLFTAACAQGETTGDAVAPLASSTEDAVEQTPAPTLPTEPAPTAEAPVEPSRVSGSASEAAGAVVEETNTAIEGNAVDDRAQRLSGLSEEAGTKVAAVAGDLPRSARLAQSAETPASGQLPSPGESPVSERPVSDKAPHTHGGVQPVSVLPRPHVAGVSGSPAGYRGFSSAEPSWLGALEGFDGIQSAPTSGTTDARSNDPAPLDGPMPAPGSSGATAGSAGSFFVPIAALLALLALVAPATLRRLGEVPAPWPPIPFVCALERPG